MKYQEEIYELVHAIEAEVKADIQAKIDNQCDEVLQQKTRFFKFKCWLVWGHLYRDGVCLRCGSIEKRVQNVSNRKINL